MEIKQIVTVNDLCLEYIDIYGRNKWSYNTYSSNCGLIDRYIIKSIGKIKIIDIDSRIINKFYQVLIIGSANLPKATKSTIGEINKLMKSMFNQACLWGILDKNPMTGVIVPKYSTKETISLTNIELNKLLNSIEEKRLSIIIQLAFACSLRKGEILALTWKDIDFENKLLRVNKEVARVYLNAIEAIGYSEIFYIFNVDDDFNKTYQVLKSPKTESSNREVYIPDTLLNQLKEYRSHNPVKNNNPHQLIFTGRGGLPMDGNMISNRFKKELDRLNLPVVTFHSLRHSSVSYKLEISSGNIKAVQGDTGHAEAKMVTDVYARTNNTARKEIANRFESEFYSKMDKTHTLSN